MRLALATTVLTAAAIAVPGAAPAAQPTAGAGGPTRKQIAAAVLVAERSTALWATINICGSRADPDMIGVRGQMPALGFAASLAMTVQVNAWSTATREFVPIHSRSATRTVSLGTAAGGLSQGGAEFAFKPPVGPLNATVTFAWTRAGTVLATASRTTTAGHPRADFGSPAHFSASTCTIR
ncbi:MAG: hypothetical protein ABSH51_24815 [Solirubrobacteraceae bacterium]